MSTACQYILPEGFCIDSNVWQKVTPAHFIVLFNSAASTPVRFCPCFPGYSKERLVSKAKRIVGKNWEIGLKRLKLAVKANSQRQQLESRARGELKGKTRHSSRNSIAHYDGLFKDSQYYATKGAPACPGTHHNGSREGKPAGGPAL